jgi:transposase
MRDKRNFSPEFKRRVVEELLSGISTPAQITRKYNISGGLLYHWKKQYALGKFENEPRQDLVLKERIKELERMVGRLTMDNDLLKKALQNTVEQSRKKESSLPTTQLATKVASGGGAE